MFRRHIREIYLHSGLIRFWRSVREFVLFHVLHADDPPHRLALGAAIGMFAMITPTMGVQSFIVLFLAWLLRANKTVGLPLVWITNPATAVPIYYPCYRLGLWLLDSPGTGTSWWKNLENPPEQWQAAMTFYWSRFLEIVLPLWVGCTVVGLILGGITYYAVYHLVVVYRRRRVVAISLPPAKAA